MSYRIDIVESSKILIIKNNALEGEFPVGSFESDSINSGSFNFPTSTFIHIRLTFNSSLVSILDSGENIDMSGLIDFLYSSDYQEILIEVNDNTGGFQIMLNYRKDGTSRTEFSYGCFYNGVLSKEPTIITFSQNLINNNDGTFTNSNGDKIFEDGTVEPNIPLLNNVIDNQDGTYLSANGVLISSDGSVVLPELSGVDLFIKARFSKGQQVVFIDNHYDGVFTVQDVDLIVNDVDNYTFTYALFNDTTEIEAPQSLLLKHTAVEV